MRVNADAYLIRGENVFVSVLFCYLHKEVMYLSLSV